MTFDKDLKPGDMILWECHPNGYGTENVHIGILVRRFDNHVENKIASRNYSPSWCWEIKFAGPKPPYNYSQGYGAGENNLINGAHGKIIRVSSG